MYTTTNKDLNMTIYTSVSHQHNNNKCRPENNNKLKRKVSYFSVLKQENAFSNPKVMVFIIMECMKG